jgi:hypothetical protein
MLKCALVKCALVLCGLVVYSSAWAGIANGGFESGLTGWTVQTTNGSNWGWGGDATVVNNYYYSGGSSLYGFASVNGDDTRFFPTEDRDWSRTYAWSDSANLNGSTSVKFYLTDFQSNPPAGGWGWGQEIFLLLNDGVHEAGVLVIDNHEPTYTSLFDLGLYTPSTGDDGRTWYCFDVPLNADAANFGSAFGNLNLANTKIGFEWEADSWYDYPQNLLASAVIDDVSLQPVPEPSGLLALAGGIGCLAPILRRRR